MEISASAVMALRNKTGLPMMDCKKALIEAGGDEPKAIEILEKAAKGRISKLADRVATEGRIACFVDPVKKIGGIIELRCETAPVANTDDFRNLANEIARHVAHADNPTPQSIMEMTMLGGGKKLGDYFAETVNRIRENMQVAKVAKFTGEIGSYVHHNGQVGVMIELSKPCPDELKADTCMHIAAMKPPYRTREEVPAAEIAKERANAAEAVKDKPPQMVEKIVSGKIDRWFAEIVLLEQPFVKDDKQSVGKMLGSKVPGLTINRFVRFEVGTA